MMKGYKFGVRWIAENDDPLDLDVDSVAGYISTCLLADLFEKNTAEVAQKIVRLRTENVVA